MKQHPNIVVILADDQGFWAMGCAGNTEIRTPTLDRLAAAGMRFDRCYCVSPVCSPARASLLTGCIPSAHGVHDWIRGGNSTIETGSGHRLIRYLQGHTAYTDVLAAHGYVCGLSGKWHLGDAHHAQHGFSSWYAHASGGGPYYNAPVIAGDAGIHRETRYITDVITDHALAFLEQRRGQPELFYLSLHYTAPHSPWARDEHPAALFDDYRRNCPFASVPDVPMHPWCNWPEGARYFESPDQRREMLSGYYAAVTAMDANIGRVLDWLAAHNLRNDTLIVFTSDNGMNMGHHGIVGKGNGTSPLNMYETSVRVPTLISRPGHVPAGVVNADLLSHYDFFPTLLAYAGITFDNDAHLPGRSFAPLLRGEPLPPRDAVVVFDEYGPVRMIRDQRFKYIHRYPDGPHELYDLVSDPNEECNEVCVRGQQRRVRDMRQQMEAWFERYSVCRFDGRDKRVSGAGQIEMADMPDAFCIK